MSPSARMPVGRLDTVVVDCPAPRELAAFYAGLLGQDVADDGNDDWQSLTGDGRGASLAFQRATAFTPPGWPDGAPQQLHLDLAVTDLTVADEQAVALGARRLDPTTPPSPADSRGFRVYADPAGHPFCLCRAAVSGESTAVSPSGTDVASQPATAAPTRAR